MDKDLLPDIHYGDVKDDAADDGPLPEVEDEPDDDEELAETPQDVIDILGFDPKELE